MLASRLRLQSSAGETFKQIIKAAVRSSGGSGGGSGSSGGNYGSSSNGGNFSLTPFLYAGGLGIAAWGAYHSMYTVNGGHLAIEFSRIGGTKRQVYGEGTHFIIPWLQYPIVIDVRSKPKAIKSLTGTRDLQMVNISLRILFKPKPEKLPEIYQNIGGDFGERVLPSIANETLKSVVAHFNASELITQRQDVSSRIKENLAERARQFNIVIDDVSITDLSFSPEYMAAVEAKQVAQQDAERAKFLVKQAIQDKKSTILKAQGEAQSAALIGEAMKNNPGYIELRQLDAAKSISDTMAKSSNKVYLDSQSLLLNILETSGSGGRMEQKK